MEDPKSIERKLRAAGIPEDQIREMMLDHEAMDLDRRTRLKKGKTRTRKAPDANIFDNFEDDNKPKSKIPSDVDKLEKSMEVESAPESAPSANMGAAQAGAQTLASGGDASAVASSALIGSGNPYAMGAGVGLAVLSAREKRKQAEQEMLYKAKLENISRQQAVISNLMNLTQRLGL